MNYFFLQKKKIKTTSFNTIPYESIIGTAFNCIIYNRRQNQNSMETIWGVQNYLFAAEYTHSLSPIRSNQETVFTVCGLGNT